MQKLKKAAAVAAMVGGIGLVGSGIAYAGNGHGYNDPHDIDNLQVVECDQDFDGGSYTLPAGTVLPPVTVSGNETENIGNFCTVIGSIDD